MQEREQDDILTNCTVITKAPTLAWIYSLLPIRKLSMMHFEALFFRPYPRQMTYL
jgi:hypothetical protein